MFTTLVGDVKKLSRATPKIKKKILTKISTKYF